MFAYGGLLKLCGDLTALVGPISITQIVRYIELANITQQSTTHDFQPASQLSSPPRHSRLYGLLGQSNQNDSAEMSRQPNDIGYTVYYPNWTDFIGNGWIMGAIVLIASLAQGSFSQASTHIVNMVGIRLRTSIQGLIYRKTLLISSSCFFAGAGTGDGHKIDDCDTMKVETGGERTKRVFDSGTITNLMSEDALNVMSFFWIAHYVWAIPLKVSIAWS